MQPDSLAMGNRGSDPPSTREAVYFVEHVLPEEATAGPIGFRHAGSALGPPAKFCHCWYRRARRFCHSDTAARLDAGGTRPHVPGLTGYTNSGLAAFRYFTRRTRRMP